LLVTLISLGFLSSGAVPSAAPGSKSPGTLKGVRQGDTQAQVRAKWRGHYQICRASVHCRAGSWYYIDQRGVQLGFVSFDRAGRVVELWTVRPIET
jgi:hypothetical protein